jgi:hypothetical protein
MTIVCILKASNGLLESRNVDRTQVNRLQLDGLSVGTSMDKKFDYLDSDVCRVLQGQDLPPTWYSNIGLGADDKRHSTMRPDPCKIMSLDL